MEQNLWNFLLGGSQAEAGTKSLGDQGKKITLQRPGAAV